MSLAVMMVLLASAPVLALDDLVEVYVQEQDDGSYLFLADNHHIIPVYVRVDATNLINLDPDTELPVGRALDAGDVAVPLFTLRPVRSTGRRGYGLQYTYAKGNPLTAAPDEDHLYLLPFAHGSKYRLSQGFNGRFSHYGDNQYAVDFEMEEGTEVHAARSGTVAEVKENSRTGGRSASYGDDANYILVLHDDGTFGNYAHLVVNGAIVEPGDFVEAGQLIGYSGNTGRSSGPHLHFDVRMPGLDGRMASVPFLFRGADGSANEPTEGRFYYAYHPGGPPFEEDLGTSIRLSDYEDYLVAYSGPADIDTRVEQVDLTFLIFVRNGLRQDTEVEIRFQLTGLESDAGPVVELTAPAQSEVLATILRPIPGASSIRYAYNISYTR